MRRGRTNLLLDTYGNLHLCERSDFSMPVGEVNSGINRTAVRQMYRDFFEKTDSPSCRSCWAGRFCTLCTAALIKNGAVQEPDRSICRSLRHAQEKQIEDLLYIKEYYPEILILQRQEQLQPAKRHHRERAAPFHPTVKW